MKDGILLAEDSENDAYLIQHAFNRDGWESELQVVHDGVEAIKYLEGTGRYSDRSAFKFPDILLLDLKMPRKGGFEVLTWINGMSGLKYLPVVVLSDSNRVEDINEAYRLGAHSYFVKTSDFRDPVKFCLAICQYCEAVKRHLDAQMPARSWPSRMGSDDHATIPLEPPGFSCCRGPDHAAGMN